MIILLLLSFKYFMIGPTSSQSRARCPLQESSPGPIYGMYYLETRGHDFKFVNANEVGQIKFHFITNMPK